jgi:hypothetical protein
LYLRRDLGGAQADHGRAARRVLVLHLQVQGVRRSEGEVMTVTVYDIIEMPGEPFTDDGADETHIYCCNPDRALCGEQLTGRLVAEDEDSDDDCIVCHGLAEMDVPCGALFCRLRSAWRGWRSR